MVGACQVDQVQFPIPHEIFAADRVLFGGNRGEEYSMGWLE